MEAYYYIFCFSFISKDVDYDCSLFLICKSMLYYSFQEELTRKFFKDGRSFDMEGMLDILGCQHLITQCPTTSWHIHEVLILTRWVHIFIWAHASVNLSVLSQSFLIMKRRCKTWIKMLNGIRCWSCLNHLFLSECVKSMRKCRMGLIAKNWCIKNTLDFFPVKILPSFPNCSFIFCVSLINVSEGWFNCYFFDLLASFVCSLLTETPLFVRSQKLYDKRIFLPWRCWRIIEIFERKWLWNPCFHKLSNLVWQQLRLSPKQRCSRLYKSVLTLILHINLS